MMRIIGLFLLFFCSLLSTMSKPLPDTTFNVAMILPFHWDEYQGVNESRGNIMLDYYHGFYLALKEYEPQGLKIKLFVYDNNNDTNITHQILAKEEFKSMNMIIAPIMNEHLHILNHFSSKNQIAVFSPFTAIDSVFPNNPLFFNAAPDEKTKAEAFYNFYKQVCPNKTLLLVKSKSEWNRGFGPELLRVVESKEKVDYKILENSDLYKLDSNFLPKWKNYLVFHNSNNIKELNTLFTFLSRQKAKFEILGDYKTSYLMEVPEDKRTLYDVKTISADFSGSEDSIADFEEFKTKYLELCSLNYSRYSLIGHDQGAFISEMLLKFQRFKANDFVGVPYRYYTVGFLFKKNLHCNQNKGLFIIRISKLGLPEIVPFLF